MLFLEDINVSLLILTQTKHHLVITNQTIKSKFCFFIDVANRMNDYYVTIMYCISASDLV